MDPAESLDGEISNLRERVAYLQAHRANLASVLLSAPHLSTRLQRPATNESLRKKAARIVKRQSDRNVESLYRACAGVTAYKVKDPDPNAIDDGNILGVRIEVFIGGKFVDTYHVLFNRPSHRHRTMLKIHHHTIPPCIPIAPLANKFLPSADKHTATGPEQDLLRFGRCLRKELVAWHMRVAAVAKLREEAGLSLQTEVDARDAEKHTYGHVVNAFVSDDDESEDEEDEDDTIRPRDEDTRILDIKADESVRRINIAWSNGNTAALSITKDGEVERASARSKDGKRVHGFGRKALGRIEGLLQRIL